jgi:hypothetical protein
MQYLNPGDTRLAKIVSPYDHKQHLAIGGTYELPIGSGKLIDIKSGVWNSIIGGFKINGVYSFQTGSPLFFSNDLVTTGQPITASTRVTTPGKALSTTAFDTTSANQFSFHLRTLPLPLGNVRTDGINQFDSSFLKDFHFPEGTYAQFRFEVFNTLNHASFAAAAVSSATSSSFGTIISQAQLGPNGTVRRTLCLLVGFNLGWQETPTIFCRHTYCKQPSLYQESPNVTQSNSFSRPCRHLGTRS